MIVANMLLVLEQFVLILRSLCQYIMRPFIRMLIANDDLKLHMCNTDWAK